MTIHEVEVVLGVSKQALIYYEKEGIVVPDRDKNNYRNYSSKDLDILKLILLLRSMELSINEIKSIIDGQLSIRSALENKQEFIKRSQIKLEGIEGKIKDYIKRHQVEVIFENKTDSKYERLMIKQDNIYFNDIVISCNDIIRVDLSMCSSKGANGKAYFLMNYYVDLDIHTVRDTYSFQVMNNQQINKLFEYFKSMNLPVSDPLKLIDIYFKYQDALARNKYINSHFKQWAKEYHLDNPRDNYISIMKEGFMAPLYEIKERNSLSSGEIIKDQCNDLKSKGASIFKGCSKIWKKEEHKDD